MRNAVRLLCLSSRVWRVSCWCSATVCVDLLVLSDDWHQSKHAHMRTDALAQRMHLFIAAAHDGWVLHASL